MEPFIEIGEVICLGAAVFGVFLFLSMLRSANFAFVIKVATPLIGFLIGLCIGAFLANLVFPSYTEIGGLLFGVFGFVGSFMLLSRN